MNSDGDATTQKKETNDGMTTQGDLRSVDMVSDKTGHTGIVGELPPGYDGFSSIRQNTGYDQTSYSKTTSKARRKIVL